MTGNKLLRAACLPLAASIAAMCLLALTNPGAARSTLLAARESRAGQKAALVAQADVARNARDDAEVALADDERPPFSSDGRALESDVDPRESVVRHNRGGSRLFVMTGSGTPPTATANLSVHKSDAGAPLETRLEPVDEVPSPAVPTPRSEPVVEPARPAEPTFDPARHERELKDRLLAERLEANLVSLQRQVDRLAQAQDDRSAQALDQALDVIQRMQTQNQINAAQQVAPAAPSAPAAAAAPAPSATADSASPSAIPTTAEEVGTGTKVRGQPSATDPERFTLQIQEAEIQEVLGMLAELAGRNILVGQNVKGTVSTATLTEVTLDQALKAILRVHGYVYETEDDLIYVSTPEDVKTRHALSRKIITKVYRPNYISVKELQTLVTPLLTEGIGQSAATTPSTTGIGNDSDQAGGDTLSQPDALLVMDYPDVITEIDAVVVEMDVPPAQVMIEAMILSVKLTDDMAFGVNFALLGKNNKDLFVSGNGNTINRSSGFPGTTTSIIPPGLEFLTNTAGAKYGMIRGDIGLFINALEEMSDTNMIAAPQLRVLNKQKAQLIIGDRISYRTLAFNGTQTAEDVRFLDAGIRLILRPFIAPDGLIRMEIHPERSSAVIDPSTGLPNQTTTEVTTNVMVRDGATVVIGGLIEEQVVQNVDRVPFLGALPVVGAAFRNKSEEIDRTELIVLITPRIVTEPADAVEGETIDAESSRQAEFFKNELCPVNRRNLARIQLERAVEYYERGELDRAMKHVESSLRHSKHNADALRLQERIEADLNARRPWLKFPSGPAFLHRRTPGVVVDEPVGIAPLEPLPAPLQPALEGEPAPGLPPAPGVESVPPLPPEPAL